LASELQVDEHAAVPPHLYGLHWPDAPAPSTVQVPFCDAKSAAEHTSQPPPQGLSQQ
jgi:hypothetical protein